MRLWISDIEHPGSARALLAQYPQVCLETLRFSECRTLDRGSEAVQQFREEFGALLERGLSVHGPYVDLLPGSCDRTVRAAARTRFLEAYRIAEQLGAESIVYHSGWLPAPYGVGDWLKSSVLFWTEFLEEARGHTAAPRVCVENIQEADWRGLAALADAVPGLSLCFDAGHAHTASPLSPREWLQGLGARIGHVHLHNNDGSRDAHRGFSFGTLDMAGLFHVLHEILPEVDAVLEIPSPEELSASLAWSVENN